MALQWYFPDDLENTPCSIDIDGPYRIVDVSTVKELVKRWYPGDFSRQPKKKLSHRALDDILESIEELKYYRREVFKEPKSKTKVEKE